MAAPHGVVTERDEEGPAPLFVAKAPPRGRRLLTGRVAYIRCDGAEINQGPIPCPRDRQLERAVWAQVRKLPACPDLPSGEGTADLRLKFESGTTEVLWHPRASPLDPQGLRACLEADLARLQTEIEAPVMVVSFQFEMVGGR